MNKLKSSNVLLILLCFLIQSEFLFSQSQNWISEQSIYTTVLLEKKEGSQIIPHGTGFLIFNYSSNFNHFLVTCAHLLKRNEIYITIPSSKVYKEFLKNKTLESFNFDNDTWIYNNGILRFVKNLIKNETFVLNDSLDIAIIPISIPNIIIKADTVSISDRIGMPKSLIGKKKNIALGRDVFFTGFPLMIGTPLGYLGIGKYSSKLSNPLVRTGTIAYVSSDEDEFLLDAFSYGGNSGSPIFLKPDIYNQQPYLVGMVLGHLGDSSPGSNIGLARCISIDKIIEFIMLNYKY